MSGRLAQGLAYNRVLSLQWRRNARTYGKRVVAASSAANVQVGTTPARSFDYTSLKAATRDLHDLELVPSKVSSIIQYHPQSVAIHLRTPALNDAHLHVCWSPAYSHVGLLFRPPRRGAASESFAFGDQLKRHIGNMILLDASVPEPWERVLKLSFGETLGGPILSELYIELMNKHSNVVLCDGQDGSILLAANQIGQRKSSQRQLQVKRQYELPPLVGGGAPSGVSSVFEFRERLLVDGVREMDVKKAVSSSFRGVGPGVAGLLVARAGIDGAGEGVACEELSDSSWDALYDEFRAWVKDVVDSTDELTAKWVTVDLAGANGVDEVAGAGGESSSSLMSPLEQFGAYYESMLLAEEKSRLYATLVRTVSKQKDKLQKKLMSLEKQADVSSQADGMKLKGDLVMSHLHLFKNPTSDRKDSVEVLNWETGEAEVILLDDAKTPLENAEKFYKQASKLKRGATKVIPLIEDCKADMLYLQDNEALLESIAASEEGDELDLLAQIELELMNNGFIKRKSIHAMQEKGVKKNKKRAKKTGGSEYKRLSSPNGFEVLVGRSSQQNDEVTMRVAKPGDIWMHARGFPGAHVLIRCAQVNNTVQDEDLEFAANLAAYYSKGVGLKKVDVIMADPKDISKPKGAKPGQVMVSKERVIVAMPEACVLAKRE